MSSLERSIKTLDLRVVQEIFQSHYKDASIDSISLDDIPLSAMNRFEGYSRRFIQPKDHVPRDFYSSFVISNNVGEKTYVVRQFKTYHDGNVEDLTYIADLDESQELISHAELRFAITRQEPFFKNKPFSGFNGCNVDIYTQDESLLNVWIDKGTTQICVMNALSYAFYGHPLHSDGQALEFEKPLWESLEKDGKVIRYVENHKLRYCFPSTSLLHSHNAN